MLSVSDALERLLAELPLTDEENISLGEGANRVLAENIVATENSPRFDNSSMDGFALRSTDLNGKNGVALKVVGDIPAGHEAESPLENGQAMRIMTGAQLPKGADAIVPIEDTDASQETGAQLPATVTIKRKVIAGDFVRPAGQDFRAGDVLLEAGHRIRSQDLGLLAQLGKSTVMVHRKTRVAIFSSGNELVAVDQTLPAGKIHETNSYVLAALVESCGVNAVVLGIAKDDLANVKAHLEKAVQEKADLILSSAGVSVGTYDYLRDAVTSNGKLDFWKVNMRPGRPFTFGNYRGIPYIGLPGNPASAFVGFEVFVRPALQKMGGVRGWQRYSIHAVLKEDVESDGRESFLRVKINETGGSAEIYLTGHQGSGNLYSLVQAQGFLHVPAGEMKLKSGSMQEVWLL